MTQLLYAHPCLSIQTVSSEAIPHPAGDCTHADETPAPRKGGWLLCFHCCQCGFGGHFGSAAQEIEVEAVLLEEFVVGAALNDFSGAHD